MFQQLWQAVKAGQEWRGEFYNRKKSGETYVEQASISPIRGSDGSIVSIVKVAEDMTERKRMEEKLRRDATYDALTGVFNRRHLLELLESAVESARRYRRPLSVCLCDIDLFKPINDAHGHHVGDEVLVAFGGILRESFRTVDLAGRYGGDEFLWSSRTPAPTPPPSAWSACGPGSPRCASARTATRSPVPPRSVWRTSIRTCRT